MFAKERIEIETIMIDNVTGAAKNITKSIREVGTGVYKTTEQVTGWDAKLRRLNRTTTSTTTGQHRFKMELLGTMFAGMALYRVMGGLLKRQYELWGITEMFGATLTVVFLPLMEMLAPILYNIMDAFMNMPEGIQLALGAFVLLGAAVGAFLMIFGQIGLAVTSLVKAFPVLLKLGGAIKGAGTAIAGVGSTFLLVAGIVAAVLVGMYLAWKENFLGMKQVVQNWIDGIKQLLGGLVDVFKGIFMIIKAIFTGDFDLLIEGLKKVFTGLWSFLVGGFKVAIATIEAVFIGALKIVINIINMILGFGGRIGNLIAGRGWTDANIGIKIPSFQTGGMMPYNGLAYLHKGETVTPVGTTNIAPNITINATIASDYDVRRLAEELKRYWVQDYERITMGRGI